MNLLKRSVKGALRACGILKAPPPQAQAGMEPPPELSQDEIEWVRYIKANNLSMTSYERLWATAMACRHALNRGIPGGFVECGVWRGGNALLAAHIFKQHGADRDVYLFDTFAGMTEPTPEDRERASGRPAMDDFLAHQEADRNTWCLSGLDEVRNHFAQAGLLSERVHFIQGDVLQTLAVDSNLPEAISVLRLDTDWYASTRMELERLYPRLSPGGTVMIDDYGYWTGSRKATDEYFERHGNRPFLHCIDPSGRAGVKF